jgi:transposase
MERLSEREAEIGLQPGVVRVLCNGKRIFAEEFKAELVRRCLVSGTSVAATAMAHGVNANLLRRWIALHGTAQHVRVPVPVMLPVTVQAHGAAHAYPSNASSTPHLIEIDFHGSRVRLHGDVDAQRLGVVLDVLAQRA